eukprot:Hpha_TRINITY_DN13052_c2_g1::TRINITY_DN13052_c2_g1_i1::g.68980::m.68980
MRQVGIVLNEVLTLLLPVSRLLVPVRFAATLVHLVALMMVLDSVQGSVAASLRGWVDATETPQLAEAFDSAERSARAGLALSFVCTAFCALGAFLGISTLQHGPSLFQSVAHGIAATLLFLVHSTSENYLRIWHVFFFFTLPAAAAEMWVAVRALWAREVAW